MLKKVNNKKGFTMVELTVTMLILVIAMGLAATLILSGSGILAKDSEVNAAKYVGDAVFSWVEGRVRYACHMSLHNEASPPSGGKQIYVGGDGRLMYNDGVETKDVFGENFYLGNKVIVTTSKAGDDLLDIKVEVFNKKDKAVYSTGSVIKLVNILNENGNMITADVDAGDTPLLRFDYDRSAGGFYPGDNFNRLATVSRSIADAVNRLLDASKTDQVKELLGLSGSESPTNTDYQNYVKQELGGSWLHENIVGHGSEQLMPYFLVSSNEGHVSGIVYYVPQNEHQFDRMTYVYNMRDSHWYSYQNHFECSNLTSGNVDAFFDWVESEDNSPVFGNKKWTKID